MGIEMEAGRPGWYDAMNGLPGLFGASMPETFELKRLLEFLLANTVEFPSFQVEIPIEAKELLEAALHHLSDFQISNDPDRDYVYWDALSSAREQYRARIQLGIDGQQIFPFLQKNKSKVLEQFIQKVDMGIQRALEMNADTPPTYFYYRVDDFEYIKNPDGQAETDPEGRPYIRAKKFSPILLPLFLEGFVTRPESGPSRNSTNPVPTSENQRLIRPKAENV